MCRLGGPGGGDWLSAGKRRGGGGGWAPRSAPPPPRAAAGRAVGELHAARLGLRHVAARLRRVRVLDPRQEDERDHRQDHEDARGAERPADLERRVAPDLGRRRAAPAPAELDQRVDEQRLHAEEDDHPDDEGDQVERLDLDGVRRPAVVLRNERSGERDGGRHEHRRDGAEERGSRSGTAVSEAWGSQGRRIVSVARPRKTRPWRPRSHAPVNAGSRFSTNAPTPSKKSFERASWCWSWASRSSWPSMSG